MTRLEGEQTSARQSLTVEIYTPIRATPDRRESFGTM